MGQIHQDAFLATTGPKESKLSQELNAVIQDANPKAARAKALLNVGGGKFQRVVFVMEVIRVVAS